MQIVLNIYVIVSQTKFLKFKKLNDFGTEKVPGNWILYCGPAEVHTMKFWSKCLILANYFFSRQKTHIIFLKKKLIELNVDQTHGGLGD